MLNVPSLSKQIKEQQLLWFSASNSYIIVDKQVNKLINLFVSTPEKSDFISTISETTGVSPSQSELFYDEINQLLSNSAFDEEKSTPSISFDTSFRTYSETYIVNDTTLQVNYSHKSVKELLHPQIAHLSSKNQ